MSIFFEDAFFREKRDKQLDKKQQASARKGALSRAKKNA